MYSYKDNSALQARESRPSVKQTKGGNMPINDIEKNISPSLPRIGFLRKGAERSPNEPGKDLDYFRLDCNDSKVREQFESFYGNFPKAVIIYLLSDHRQSAFSCWYEEWSKTKIVRRCDGEVQDKKLNQDGTYSTGVPCEKSACKCKATGRLFFIPHGISRLGYFQLSTTSIYDVARLSNELEGIKSLAGCLKGIPLKLYRANEEVMISMNGNKQRAEKSLIHLEVHPKFVSRLMEISRDRALKGETVETVNDQQQNVDPETGEVYDVSPQALEEGNSEEYQLPESETENEETTPF